MGKIVEFDIDEEVADKFNVALLLNKDAGNYLIEQFTKKYITLSFKEAAQAFRPDTKVTPENINMIRTTGDEYKGKAIDKIQNGQ